VTTPSSASGADRPSALWLLGLVDDEPARPYGARSEESIIVGDLLLRHVPALARGDLEIVAIAIIMRDKVSAEIDTAPVQRHSIVTCREGNSVVTTVWSNRQAATCRTPQRRKTSTSASSASRALGRLKRVACQANGT
jgi:hypothetical protein